MSHNRVSISLLVSLFCANTFAADVVPPLGQFPPAGVGVYLAGELVSVDHVNRRGAIRLVGDNNDDRYHWAPSHRFAMLPYGMLRYHGAPAELRDIPIGTVLHGYFVLPPEGDTSVPPPDRNAEKYVPKQTHALLLEDDVSFYQRQGQAWKVISIEPDKGKLKVAPVTVEPDANAARIIRRDMLAAGSEKDGLQGEQLFEIDASTRVFQGKQFAELKDIVADQIVQLNLTWAPDWKNGQFHVSDVWLDAESRAVAAEMQRRIHVHHQRTRWLAGWIDHVEHLERGQGIVTVTLFAGADPSLYDAAKAQAKSGGASIAAAEPTLRTWWQEHDSKNGPVLDYKELPNPPLGSSGLQLRVRLYELLDGYRPGRIVRVRPNSFPNVKLPPEERVKNLDDR